MPPRSALVMPKDPTIVDRVTVDDKGRISIGRKIREYAKIRSGQVLTVKFLQVNEKGDWYLVVSPK